MNGAPVEFKAARRGRQLVAMLIVSIIFDLFVTVTAIGVRSAFLSAPNNESLQPDDDTGYFLSSVFYLLSSALRDLVIIVLLAVLAHWWVAARRRPASGVRRLGWLWPALLAVSIACEFTATAIAWSMDEPTELFVGARVASCCVNAVLSIAAILVFRARGRGSHRAQVGLSPSTS